MHLFFSTRPIMDQVLLSGQSFAPRSWASRVLLLLNWKTGRHSKSQLRSSVSSRGSSVRLFARRNPTFISQVLMALCPRPTSW